MMISCYVSHYPKPLFLESKGYFIVSRKNTHKVEDKHVESDCGKLDTVHCPSTRKVKPAMRLRWTAASPCQQIPIPRSSISCESTQARLQPSAQAVKAPIDTIERVKKR